MPKLQENQHAKTVAATVGSASKASVCAIMVSMAKTAPKLAPAVVMASRKEPAYFKPMARSQLVAHVMQAGQELNAILNFFAPT